MTVWFRYGSAEFGSSPIRTIIRLGTFTVSAAESRRLWISAPTEPSSWQTGKMRFARRNAKRSDVRKVLKTAAENFDELAALWEKARGRKESSKK
jgi:hypothetical protein